MDMLERNMLDGIIACADPLPDFVSRKGKPIISMDRNWGPEVPLIRSDHEQGGRIAAEVFLKEGCKKIVQFYAKRKDGDTGFIHHEVLSRIMEEHHCETVTVNTKLDELSYTYNKNVILQYLDLIREADGMMATDIGAMSCLAVARKMGIRVPEELKIIGYDGTEITNLTYPELSVIVQDCEEVSRKCVETVLNMVDGKEPEQMEILVPVTWKQGGTTAKFMQNF